MKRVIALATNYWTENGKVTNKVAIHKDSIYHITSEVFDSKEQIVRGVLRQGLILYQLLEIIGYHDEALFKELPDDFIEDEVVEQTEELISGRI